MLTTLRVIRWIVPVLMLLGIFNSSCDKDDSGPSNNNTNNNNTNNNNNNNNTNNNNNNNNTGNCNNNGNLNYGNCITCVLLLTYSNGNPAYSYSQTLCPNDFSSPSAFRAYITAGCSYDGYVSQGSGYTATYHITCRN